MTVFPSAGGQVALLQINDAGRAQARVSAAIPDPSERGGLVASRANCHNDSGLPGNSTLSPHSNPKSGHKKGAKSPLTNDFVNKSDPAGELSSSFPSPQRMRWPLTESTE